MQGDSPKVRRLCLPKIHYFIFDEIVPTDKLAEKKFTLAENGRQKIFFFGKKAVPL